MSASNKMAAAVSAVDFLLVWLNKKENGNDDISTFAFGYSVVWDGFELLIVMINMLLKVQTGGFYRCWLFDHKTSAEPLRLCR